MRVLAMLLARDGCQLPYSLWTEPARGMMHCVMLSSLLVCCNLQIKWKRCGLQTM